MQIRLFDLMSAHKQGFLRNLWDKSSGIDYKLPGRGAVWANFSLTQAQIDDILARTAGGEKYEPWFSVDVVDHGGNVVATIDKHLYIRRKPAQAAEPSSAP